MAHRTRSVPALPTGQDLPRPLAPAGRKAEPVGLPQSCEVVALAVDTIGHGRGDPLEAQRRISSIPMRRASTTSSVGAMPLVCSL